MLMTHGWRIMAHSFVLALPLAFLPIQAALALDSSSAPVLSTTRSPVPCVPIRASKSCCGG